MVINSLPDISAVNQKNTGLANRILFAYSDQKYFYPEHQTPYLLITNYLNEGQYALNGNYIRVSDKCFYFLNTHDRLAITFNECVPLKTLFVFFNELFVNESIYSVITSDDLLLTYPLNNQQKELTIPSVPFSSNPVILQLLMLLGSGRLNQFEIDNKLFELITEFVGLSKFVSLNLNKIKAKKKSTKEELFKRLYTAKEFIEDNALLTGLTIDDMAKEACLNKFHFLTNFKDRYGITPHQYLMDLKLQKAYELLKNGQNQVTDVCYTIGFESVTTFSSLFKRKFNQLPSSVSKENKIPNFQ